MTQNMPAETEASAGSTGSSPGGRGIDFAQVVARYETPLLRYVSRLLNRGPVDVEDIVQDTLLRLHRHALEHGPGSIGNLKSWLFRVAHNRAMDVRRKRQRRDKAHENAVALGQVPGEDGGDAIDHLGALAQREATDRAMAELERLPDDQRSIVLLKIHHGLSLRQIARVTDMSLGNVNYRLNQALKTLAQRLKSHGVI